MSDSQKLNTKEGKQLGATVDTLTTKLKSNEKAVGDNRRNVGNYEEALGKTNASLDKLGAAAGKLPGPLGAMATGIIGATKASLAFIATPLGMVLAAVALAIGAVKLAFASSEEGQNKWNKIVTVGSALLGNFTDIIADFGEAIIEAFENPQKAVEDFSNLIKDNLINRFNGLLELVPALGESLELLFKGKVSEAGKVAADAVAKVALGVEDITDKTNGAIEATAEFMAEQEKELAQAAQVADMRAKADIVERQLLVDRAKAEAEVADLRLRARKEDEFTASQRKAFLQEANSIQNELLDAETEYLGLRADAQILENTFSKTNKENKDKEAQAIAALSQIETKRFTEQRQLQRELNTITNQMAAESKAQAEIKRKLTEDEIKQEEERIVAITKGFEDQRTLIDDMAETEKNLAAINISDAEERAEKIAFIEREALQAKLMSIDDETAAYTASADMVGAVDEEKYAKQLALRAKFEAELAEANRAARAQEFNDKIAALSLDEQLEMEAAEFSIDNERDLAARKGQIALGYLTQKMELMRAQAEADDLLTENEIKNLQLVENEIKRIQDGIQENLDNPDAPNVADMLGLTDDEFEKMNAGLELASQAIQTLQGILTAAANVRLDEIDFQSSREIQAIEESEASEESKAAKIKSIESKAAQDKYKIELEQFKTSKATAVILGLINTALSVIKSLPNIPLAILAGLAGAASVAVIASQKPPSPPKFARGGYVSGAGTETSDSIDAKLSTGESVNNARTTRMFGREISAMNAAGGGVDWFKNTNASGNRFAQGGIVSPTFAARQTTQVAGLSRNDLAEVIAQMPAPIVTVSDINRVQGQVATVSQSADL